MMIGKGIYVCMFKMYVLYVQYVQYVQYVLYAPLHHETISRDIS